MMPETMLKAARLVLAILALTPLAYGQANQGGAYVSWDPIYPMPAYDTYEWTMTVTQLPIVQSYYYWALQNGFVGGSGAFYMGLQPFGSCGITNAGNCKIALFSFFGAGATSTSQSCTPGADGGPGESCRIPYEWVIGRPYKLVATLVGNDGTYETWAGTVTDTVTGVQTTIGSWSIPASNGLIGSQGISFAEYYEIYSGGCGAEPYAEVIWSVPIGYSKGQAYPGSVRSTASTPGCPQNSASTLNPGSVVVQTGGSLGPFISSVQDAESSRASIVPGEWTAIYGGNLSSTTRTWNSGDFTNGNMLPTSLDGVSVRIGGIAAPVYFVSPRQVNAQVPSGLSGTVPVTVTVNGAQSVSYYAMVLLIAPSLFIYTGDAVIYAVAQHADGSLIGDASVTPNSSPANPGETIALYVNGLEASDSGVIVSTPVPTKNPVAVMIGGMNAPVIYQGLIGAGLFQVNATVPALSNGSYPVFSDLVPGNLAMGNNGPGYCISGSATPDCGPLTNRWIASPFTLSGNFTLTKIDLALGWLSGTNGAVVNLVNSQNRLPATTVLKSWTVTQLPYTGPTNLITLTATDAITLKRATQYWLVVKGLAANSVDSWSGNVYGLTGTLLSLDSGMSWNNGVLNLSAFDVWGAPSAAGSAALPVVVTAGGVSSQMGVSLIVATKP